jgi:hypothetical protein
MQFLHRPRNWVGAGAALVAAFLLYEVWVWGVERVEVPPDQFLVAIKLWGTDLPEGEVLAPDRDHKGVQRELLPEGRHFLNPLLWSYERHMLTAVPPGKCLVLTRRAGADVPADRLARGEFLAGEGERGIVEKVLLPGKHRINPYEYDTELVDAREIKAHQVGVRVLKWGKDPRTLKGRASPYVVPEGYRGVQERPVPPGTYYLNPYVEEVVAVDIRSHPVEFTDIEFPSRDGFLIRPHVLVAYKVLPDKAPELFVTLCDEGVLHQEDATEEQKRKNEILQKVVLPLIRGYVRIEGSKYDARDYISQQEGALLLQGAAAVGLLGAPAGHGPLLAAAAHVKRENPRERLQKELVDKVAPQCRQIGVVIDAVTVAQPELNQDLAALAAQISERERLRVVREKNEDLVAQYKQDQERRSKELLKEQEEALAVARGELAKAKTRAEQDKQVEKAKLEQELKSAEVRLAAARDQAKAVLTKGKAEAAVIAAQNEAEVAGLRTAVLAFPSPDHYARYRMVKRLAPALAEVFASDTSDFARLFADRMAPAPKRPAAPPKGVAGGGGPAPPSGR